MKRIILSVAILAAVTSAIEITVVGGGNYQAMNPDWRSEGSGAGWGWHGGALAEIAIVPSFLGIYIGLEGGFNLEQANYSYISAIPEDPAGVGHQLNLILPLFVIFKLAPEKPFHIQWGVGPTLIRFFYGWWNNDAGESGVVDKQYFETDLGLGLKGEANIKLADRLWLTPAISTRFNLTAKDTWLQNSKHLFFSLGLTLKL